MNSIITNSTEYDFLCSLPLDSLAIFISDVSCPFCVFDNKLCSGDCKTGISLWLRSSHNYYAHRKFSSLSDLEDFVLHEKR